MDSLSPETTAAGGVAPLTASVSTVRQLLSDGRLHIPSYQRPYSWSGAQISQLVDDIESFREVGSYRLGTVILHRDGDRLDVVDGQQRYLSFGLVAAALVAALPAESEAVKDLEHLVRGISLPERWDGATDRRLRENALRLDGIFARWSMPTLEAFTAFFLDHCSVVKLAVTSLDAAFQMFDSQNTRGRALDPTDLLKAYHLREYVGTGAPVHAVLDVVTRWEAIPSDERSHLFADLLFPTMRWSAGRQLPARRFTAADISAFKGVRAEALTAARRWAHPVLFAQAYVDDYNAQHRGLIDHGVLPALDFPFQLTLPVIDGAMFFAMANHYVALTRRLGVAAADADIRAGEDALRAQRDGGLQDVLDAVRQAGDGAGDGYVRQLFGCLLLAFADRFGEADMGDAADLLARHAYLVRAGLRRVQRSSVENHALGRQDRTAERHRLNLFDLIAHAHDPGEVLRRDRATVDDLEKGTHLDPAHPVMTILSTHRRTAVVHQEEIAE